MNKSPAGYAFGNPPYKLALAPHMNHELREGKYHATPAELAVIHRGLKSADEGRFATDAAKALEGAKGKRLMYRQPR